jgi:hypothetical protein
VLSRYHAVALLTATTTSSSSLGALEGFAKQGGQLLATRSAATLTENGEPRPSPSFLSGKIGQGSAILVGDNEPIERLAKDLSAISGKGPVRLDAPPQVLYNVTEQASRGRTIVHLLNYGLEKVPSLTLEVLGHYKSAYLISPDGSSRLVTEHVDVSHTRLRVDSLGTYSLIVLTDAEQQGTVPPKGKNDAD